MEHYSGLFCDITVVISQNGNVKDKQEFGDKDGAELKHPVYAAQI